MKKTLLASLALTAVAGFSATASAQSSVTLFGTIDLAARQIDNGGTKLRQLGTDGLSSSALGFRGVEDLGNGLKAGFWLESAFYGDDGTTGNTSGKFWHRRSTVSLEGSFGEVRLGRDYSPTYTGISDFSAYGDTGIGKFSNIQSRLGAVAVAAQTAISPAVAAGPVTLNTNARADNLVQYFLPKSIGGVYGSLAVAAGEGSLGNKYVGGRLGYQAGPVNVSASYGTTEVDAAGDKYKIGSVGGAYDFGALRLLGSVAQMKLLDRKEMLYLVGTTIPVGPGIIRASVGRANLSGPTTATAPFTSVAGVQSGDDATQVAVGYIHNLSKRTALYADYAQINNKGAQTFKIGNTSPNLLGGQKSKAFDVGIRHSF
jgi:predicted porin